MKLQNRRLAALSRRLDPLWRLLGWSFRSRDIVTKSLVPRSILVVDLHLVGDIVMLVPMLRVIRRCHPQARLGLMAGPWAGEILADTELVDEFITLRAPWVVPARRARGLIELVRAIAKARRGEWDWGIDMRGDVRNILLLVVSRARRRVAFDFTGGAALLTDVVPDDGVLRHIIDHHAAIARYLGMPMIPGELVPVLGSAEKTGPGPSPSARVIGFHFGASMVLRRMPLREACLLLSHYRSAENTRLILIDAPDVQSLNTALLERLPKDFRNRIERWRGTLSEFIALLRRLDKFYAMDSGPAHLAAAIGVDTTVFFGPNLPLAVRPRGRKVTVIEQTKVTCRPCDQHHCINPNYQECLTGVALLAETEHIAVCALVDPAAHEELECNS